ncbi:MAG: nucleoside hydrolase, partial [Thermoprotei archaeon]
MRVAVDTDIGDDIDDALALALAALSPELELVAVTTVYGDVRTRAKLAARLLRALGREDVPVAAGTAKPLYGEAPERPPLYSSALEGGGGYSN